MTARIFKMDGDERFVRAESSDPTEAFDRVEGGLAVLPRTPGFSGDISLPLLPDLIQIYMGSMADGALTIGSGKQTGTIWFERGAMVHAVCGELEGEEAVYRLLEWQDGRFSLDKGATTPFHSITASSQEVLMEGCRRLDEAAFAASSAASGPFDEVVLRIDQALTGCLAAVVIDSEDGSVVAKRVRSSELDFEAAGPLVAELLRQQAAGAKPADAPAALDSISILGDQVHLVEVLPEKRLLYVAVAREGANLAVVRRVVNRALGRLS